MVALCAAMLVIPGCGFLQHPGPVLDDVIFDVQDAASILSTIRSVVEIFFMAHPAPGVQATVEKALADAELGLNAAVRATRGAKELSKEQLDAAWRDFRLAWSELEHILHDAGVVTGDGKFAVAREGREGEIRFPVPLAMGR